MTLELFVIPSLSSKLENLSDVSGVYPALPPPAVRHASSHCVHTLDLGKCKTEECGVKSAVHLCRVTPEGILSRMGNDVLRRIGGTWDAFGKIIIGENLQSSGEGKWINCSRIS